MQAVLDIIRLNPEHHNQAKWESSCGTTRCVAGWVAFVHPELLEGECVTYGEAGMVGLGIGPHDAGFLFHWTSDDEAIHAMEYLAKGEPIDWKAVKNS